MNVNLLNVARLLHVVSILMLVAGQLPLILLMKGVVMEPDPRARLSGLKMMRTLNMGLIMPGSILAGLTGFALAGIRHLPITTPWLLASVVLYVAALVLGKGFLMPWTKRMIVAAEAEQAGAPAGTFLAAAKPTPVVALARSATPLITIALLILMILH